MTGWIPQSTPATVVIAFRAIARDYANRIRAQRGKPGDFWHLDEVFIKIRGRLQYLWRAVDQYSRVLDVFVQSHRDKQAAARFFKELLTALSTVTLASSTVRSSLMACCKMSPRSASAHKIARNWSRNAD